MDLYQTKSQVYEMLCCAGKCRNRSCSPSNNNNNSISNNNNNNNGNPYLTFEDYSVFASEMKRAYAEDSATAPASKIAHKCDKIPSSTSDFVKSNKVDSVFLGGSCNPTTWRQDIAIPMLKSLGISYYNPQVANWEPGLIDLEHKAKSNAHVLFFVVDNQTRATAAIIEVAYLVAKQRNVILVISGFKGPGQKIYDEPISQIEYEELTCGQLILQDLVERHGIPVFNDIKTALECTAKMVMEITDEKSKLTDLEHHLQHSNLNLWLCRNLKKTFESLDTTGKGEISLADFHRAYRILMNRELTREEVLDVLEGIKTMDKELMLITPPPVTEPSLKKEANGGVVNGVGAGTVLNFEQFCYIMAELVYHNHHHRSTNSNINHHRSSWSNQVATKASFFVRNISLTLTRLLENIPGSKPGWMPLSSKPCPPESTESKTQNVPVYDVYLGGAVITDDKWRSDIAAPLLKKHGLTYLNPETSQGNQRLFPTDISGVDKCKLLFFYLPNSTRSLESSVLAVYYIGLGCQVVLCIENIENDCQIDGEKLSPIAVKDYNRGRSYLSDMAKKDGVQVFQDLSEALEKVVELTLAKNY